MLINKLIMIIKTLQLPSNALKENALQDNSRFTRLNFKKILVGEQKHIRHANVK